MKKETWQELAVRTHNESKKYFESQGFKYEHIVCVGLKACVICGKSMTSPKGARRG